MNKSISERVARRFKASQEQGDALRVLSKIERFLDAYDKATRKFYETAMASGFPEEGYVDEKPTRHLFQSLSKFSAVARDLGNELLDDLYYDTEGMLKNKARDTYARLKSLVLEIFSGNRPPNLSKIRAKPVTGGVVLLSVDSLKEWSKATQKWLGDTRKALKEAEKETKKKSNWT